MMGQPMGTGGVGTSVAVGASNSILQGSGLYSYTDHEEGTYSSGSFALSCMTYNETAWSVQSYTSSGQQTSTTNTSGQHVLAALNTQNSSLSCYQSASAQLHAEGQYNHDAGWSLSSYNLTGTTALTVTQGEWSGGVNTASGTDTAGNGYTAGGSDSLSQTTYQLQSGSQTEQGAYANGRFNLSLVSFTAAESDSFTYQHDSSSNYTGYTPGSFGQLAMPTSGHDVTSVTAGGRGQKPGGFEAGC